MFFSHGTPNLPSVIPAMDHIDTTFTKLVRPGSKTNPAIRVAISTAKQILNCYYSRTDDAEVYRIAMGEYTVTNILYFFY